LQIYGNLEAMWTDPMPINLKEYLVNSGTSLVLHEIEILADTDLAQLLDLSDQERQAISAVVLSNTHITGECFQYLALLPNLKALYGGGTRVKDDAPFDLLSKTIEILNLDRTEVSDRCILKLRNLPRLRLLSLRQTAITDNGIPLLRAMPSLCEYYLNGTIVSDYAKQRLDNAIKLDSITFAKALYFGYVCVKCWYSRLLPLTL
jgi:Leucine-rich repeat (LRR) protein